MKEPEASSIDLYVLIEGQGPPIVFIHGWAASHRFWQYQLPYFRHTKQAITYDLRGHANSEKPKKGYSIEAHVQDLCQVVETLNLNNPILVGHSLGGMIALQYSLDSSNPPKALVLVGSSARPVSSWWEGVQLTLFGWLIRMSRSRASQFTRDRIFAPNVDPDLIDWVNNESLQTPSRVISQCLSAVKRFNVLTRLHEIIIPTALIQGEYESAVDPGIINQMMTEMPNAQKMIISNAGHNCMLEQPESFNNVLADFLRVNNH